MKLKDRVAIITGAGRGIGRAIAIAYAAEGASLALAARTSAELEETAGECRRLGVGVIELSTDVTDVAQVNGLVEKTVERFGAVDIMVNNAGVIGPVAPLHQTSPEDWAWVLKVNVMGVFLCCRAVVPVMVKQGHGKIINMSGRGGRNMIAYGVTKEGVVYLTETLAEELAGADIQVNAISPGSIHTQMWEETRDRAKEIGDAELYEKGQQVTSGGGASIDRAAELAVFLGSAGSGKLSGRLLRSYADDFDNMGPKIGEIMASDALTMRRVEPG